jgi:hypothetical protein
MGGCKMNIQKAQTILDQLANREIIECKIMKEHFMEFRQQLVKRADFKHFRGDAQHNGEVIYTYLDEPRS